jgi:hypothetical protein
MSDTFSAEDLDICLLVCHDRRPPAVSRSPDRGSRAKDEPIGMSRDTESGSIDRHPEICSNATQPRFFGRAFWVRLAFLRSCCLSRSESRRRSHTYPAHVAHGELIGTFNIAFAGCLHTFKKSTSVLRAQIRNAPGSSARM